jgi:uncharacterized protein involved in exopolysaccharide biosynthesis
MASEIVYPARATLPASLAELPPAEARSHFALTLFKWYRLILAFGLAVAVVAGIAMLLRPALPTAAAKILIKTGQDMLPISGLPAPMGRPSDEFLQTEAQLFSSRVVLLPVARALRQERGETPSAAQLDADISALRSGLAVSVVPGTTMLQAQKSSRSQGEAEQILGKMIDSYVDQHATSYAGPAGLLAFFEREASTAAAHLRDAEERLQRWREANDIAAAENQLTVQSNMVGEFDAGLRRTDVEIEGTRAQIQALTQDIAGLPRESVTGREQMANPLIARLKSDIATEEATLVDPNRSAVIERLRTEISAAEIAARDATAAPIVTKLRGDLVTAELALADLRQRYFDEDRHVKEKLEQVERLKQEIGTAERDAMKAASERLQNLRQELATAQREVERAAHERIAKLRAQLKAAEHEREVFGRQTLAPNPLRQSLDRDLATARARLTTLISQREGLRHQVQEAKAGLLRLQDKRLDADRIAREVELAKGVYLQNAKRLEDARLTVGLRKHQLTNVAVIEPPRASAGSRSLRHVALVSALGAVVGVGLGVAVALALDFFNWALRTPEDVEFYLGVPALAAIPAVGIPGRGFRALPVASPRETVADEVDEPGERA